jgi:hypothetical protein
VLLYPTYKLEVNRIERIKPPISVVKMQNWLELGVLPPSMPAQIGAIKVVAIPKAITKALGITLCFLTST